MTSLLEGQIHIWDGMGEVWSQQIIDWIRKTLNTRNLKQWGKNLESTE